MYWGGLVSEHEELNNIRKFIRDYIPKDAQGQETPLNPLIEILKSRYWKVQLEAIKAIQELMTKVPDPTQIVPLLLEALQNDHPKVRKKAMETLVTIVRTLENLEPVMSALLAAVQDRDWTVKGDEVGEFGPLVVVLLEVAKKYDDYVDPIVVQALMALTDRVKDLSAFVPVLRKSLYSAGEDYVRWDVVKALGEIGPNVRNPSEVVETLLEVVFEPDKYASSDIKRLAAESLLNIVEGLGDPSSIIPTLAQAFSLDEDFEHGSYQEYYPYAGLAFDLFRTIAEKLEDPLPVVSPLLWLLEADYVDVSWSLVRYKMIDPLHADIRWAVAETLEAICWRLADPSVLVGPLISRFYTENYSAWPSAWLFAVVVCQLSGFTHPIPVLRKTLAEVKVKEKKEDGGADVEACGWILSQLENPLVVLPTLQKLLKGHEDALAEILGEIGRQLEDPSLLVPMLLQLLENEDSNTTYRAVMALQKVAPKLQDISPLALPVVQAVLKIGVTDYDVEWEAMIGVLTEITGALEDPSMVVNAILAAVQDENERMSYEATMAFRTLTELLENPENLITVLVNATKDEDGLIRDLVVEALGTLANKLENPEAIDMVAATLMEALKDEHNYVRREAAEGLKNIGDKLEEVIPVIHALQAALSDDNREVRLRAMEALEKLQKRVGTLRSL